MTREEIIRNLLTELIEMIDNGNQRDLDRADEIATIIIKVLEEEPCKDCISRTHLLDEIDKLKKSPWFNDGKGGLCWQHDEYLVRKDAVEIVEDLCIKQEPSVKQEQKTGHWNTYTLSQGGIDEEWLECSECMWSNALLIPRNYCPNCGAKMESEV